jgi:hypothetical protein
MEEAKEFSQESLGEMIISSRVIKVMWWGQRLC